MKHKILIVEDNPDIANLIQLHSGDIECDSDIAHDGREAISMFKKSSYDLVILDLMLPVVDGLDVCRQLRAQVAYVPIIMLTSKSSELDRVLGLEVGADDYITKPFSIPELMARIKAQFRQVNALQESVTNLPSSIYSDDLEIDINKRKVVIRGKEITLTAREFDLLYYFASHPGQVYTRSQLLEHVWGYHYAGYEHTVNSHINRLRAKIEDDSARPRYIITVWGVGYRFTEINT